ncbi:MAG: hypothetical protein ACQEU4_10945 [Bacillota bacterium]
MEWKKFDFFKVIGFLKGVERDDEVYYGFIDRFFIISTVFSR